MPANCDRQALESAREAVRVARAALDGAEATLAAALGEAPDGTTARLVPQKRAAALAGISIKTLQRKAATNQDLYVKRGGRWWVRLSVLEGVVGRPL